jgi:hypothetical protein
MVGHCGALSRSTAQMSSAKRNEMRSSLQRPEVASEKAPGAKASKSRGFIQASRSGSGEKGKRAPFSEKRI